MSTDHNDGLSLYSPLATSGSIRLLILLPRKEPDDNIECTLSQVLLDDNPVYDALSYVWGDEMATDSILVNKKPFQTTKNLRNALSLIRRAAQPIILWVDAICINQRDLDERRDQVLQMRRIYASAKQVRIMLGDDDHEAEDVQLSIPLLGRLAECYRLLEKWKAEGHEHPVEKYFQKCGQRFHLVNPPKSGRTPTLCYPVHGSNESGLFRNLLLLPRRSQSMGGT